MKRVSARGSKAENRLVPETHEKPRTGRTIRSVLGGAAGLVLAAAGATVPAGVASATPNYSVTATIDVEHKFFTALTPALASDAFTHTLFVGTESGLAQINEQSNVLGSSLLPPKSPWALAVDQSAGLVYAANLDNNTVVVLSEKTDKLIATIPVGSGPTSVALNRSTNTVYAAHSGGIRVINGTTHAITKTIPDPNDPVALAVNRATNTVYAVNAEVGHAALWAISGATNKVTAQVPLSNPPTSAPEAVAVDQPAKKVYVVNNGKSLTVVSATTNKPIGSVHVPGSPKGIAVDATEGAIFVTQGGGGSVSVINPGTGTVVNTLKVGQQPNGVAVNSNTHVAYVSNQNSGTVSVISP